MFIAPLPTKPSIHTGGNADPLLSTQFFIHRLGKSDGVLRSTSLYLHPDLTWRPTAIDGEAPTGYYATEAEAKVTLERWYTTYPKAA